MTVIRVVTQAATELPVPPVVYGVTVFALLCLLLVLTTMLNRGR